MLSRDLLIFQRPLLNVARSTDERIIIQTAGAALAILQSAFSDKGASLIIALAACAAALAAETAVNLGKPRILPREGSCLVTALTLTLLLPNTIHPLYAAAGVFFAIFVVKHTFGGLGANWFNPALGGWLFIRFSWPNAFQSSLQNSSLTFISGLMRENQLEQFSSPVSILNRNGFGIDNGTHITNFLNTKLFSIFNIELPTAYMDFFLNPGTGLIADRGIFALLAGTIIIAATMVSRASLSALYIGILLIAIRLGGASAFSGPSGPGDMIFGLFSGATVAIAFFVVVEPVTGPKSMLGRIIYVSGAALLSYFFRYVQLEGCGAIYAVVMMNLCAPLIRMIEESWYYGAGGVTTGSRDLL